MAKLPVIHPHNKVPGEDPVAMIPLAQLRFSPPRLKSLVDEFVWPLGTEGFRRSGAPTLGIHKYLGAANVDVQIAHLDEGHIELSGTFPGLTGKTQMADLLDVLTDDGVKELTVPGVFARVQMVFTENYDFTHPVDDRSHSVDYTVSFIKTGAGDATQSSPTKEIAATAVDGATILPNSPRSGATAVLALAQNTFVVTGSTATLREIAAVVYGDSNEWKTLVQKNKNQIQLANPTFDIATFQIPTARLPIGTKIVY